MNEKKLYTKDSVTSYDGTKIGYRQIGSGPGIILLHGGINASQHLMKLATLLSDEFTVYIPDRRGRGMSGPIGDNYTIEKEDEDLDAIIKKTGSHYVFGTADGALFALHAAINNSDIHKVVAYEPLIFFGQPGIEEFKTIIQHYDEHMAEGDVAAAMESLTKDSKKYMVINIAADFMLVPIFKLALKLDARKVKGDDVSLQELLPTLHDELEIVQNTEGTLENYKDVSAEVLLLGGSKTEPMLKETLHALDKLVPHSHLVELEGLNHGSAQDYGNPEPIAQEIKNFFREIK
ncbi:MAG: esterase [Methanobacteriales archaeon HGW-Methanobacteriales-1]|jgi:pimeloyl-ACP methyl ester carboxylesterase|nr:MAG: esterase [Methanobacteriales archaeon HGW-Methanobacteriales-1]